MNTQRAYWTMIGSYLALMLILLAQTFSNVPQALDLNALQLFGLGLIIWLVKILPLLLFIPGLIKRRHSTSAWLSYMSMLYLVLGVLLTFTQGASSYGWSMSIATLVLFLSSMLYTRWHKADLRKETPSSGN